ncbi:MAG: GntR family transcriptional regulator [Bacillota bacterium]
MRDRRPLYAQVAQKIRADFSAQSTTETVRLPGESALAERYGVSRTTIREAHRLLEQEGSIFARHGVGTFLSSHVPGTTYTFDTLTPGESAVSSAVEPTIPTLIGCTMLPMSRVLRVRFSWAGDTLLRLERTCERSGKPVSYSIDVVPAAFVGGALDEGSLDKPLDEILKLGGFAAHHVDSLLTAVMAPVRVLKEIPSFEGRPVIRSQEVYYGPRGQVLAICLSYQDSTSMRFRIRRRVS